MLDVNSLPPNSHKYRESKENAEALAETPKHVEKVVSGKVIMKKKSLWKRLGELFIAEDISDVKSYIFMDVVIPAIKNAIVDTIQNGTDMLFNGRIRGPKPGSGGYGSYYKSVGYAPGPTKVSRPRPRSSYQELIFETRAEAEDVLDSMIDLMQRYHQVTVADLFDAAGVSGNGYTDNSYGWTDLSSAAIVKDRRGYLLSLPNCVELD